jgi:DNA repair exonuclease SbcCD ATPase subunit
MPCQEAKFKEMTRYANLKVNHGFKKKEVFNRMVANKLEKAEKSLNYDIERVNNLQEKLEGVKRQIEKRRAQWEKASEKLKSQIETIHHKIREQRGDDIKFITTLEKRNEELEEVEATYEKRIVIL